MSIAKIKALIDLHHYSAAMDELNSSPFGSHFSGSAEFLKAKIYFLTGDLDQAEDERDHYLQSNDSLHKKEAGIISAKIKICSNPP